MESERTGGHQGRDPGRDAVERPRGAPPSEKTCRVEAISIGRDLLRGWLDDRNSPALARAVFERGGRVHRVSVVDDDESVILDALHDALRRQSQLVVTTGGLGPGVDDRTRAAVGAALGLPLVLDHEARASVEAAYKRLHEERTVSSAGINPPRERMCRIPVGGTAIRNPVGLAPGILHHIAGGATIVCLPGWPAEAQAVFDEALPLFKDLFPGGEVALREIESPTADESALRPLIEQLSVEHPGVWISTRSLGAGARGRKGTRVLVTLEATGSTREDAFAALGVVQRRLLALAAGSC